MCTCLHRCPSRFQRKETFGAVPGSNADGMLFLFFYSFYQILSLNLFDKVSAYIFHQPLLFHFILCIDYFYHA